MSNDISDWLANFNTLNEVDVEEVENKTYKVDMFKEVLPALDRGDKTFYDKKSDEQKRELEKNMWLTMRYMSSSKNHSEYHIMMVNDIVNCDFNKLVKKATLGKEGHPRLQWKLLAMCGSGKSQFHEFIKPPRGMQKNRLEEVIMEYFPALRNDELELLLKLNSKDDLVQFFKDNGYDDKSIKELFPKGK